MAYKRNGEIIIKDEREFIKDAVREKILQLKKRLLNFCKFY